MSVTTVLANVPIIERYLGDRPWWLPLGWLKVESSGILSLIDRTVAKLKGEFSLFQISKAEADEIGADPTRLTKDPEYSVSMGFALIDRYAAIVQNLGVNYGSDTFWLLVKFCHGAGSGACKLLINRARENGVDINDWGAIANYALANDVALSAAVHHASGYFTTWIGNANSVYSVGQSIDLIRQSQAPPEVTTIDKVEDVVSENPLVAISLAVGLGLVAFFLFGRKGR